MCIFKKHTIPPLNPKKTMCSEARRPKRGFYMFIYRRGTGWQAVKTMTVSPTELRCPPLSIALAGPLGEHLAGAVGRESYCSKFC